MKKLTVTLLTLAMGATLIAGCGKEKTSTVGAGVKNDSAAYLMDFDPNAYVELCDYKDIDVTAVKKTVSDEELAQYVEYVRAYYAELSEITDRTDVQDGDICIIDYVGKIDGEAFEGGTAEDSQLTIGSGQFIDGFESGMIGMQVGETRDLNLKFPENYGSEDLAGKDAVFTVTVKSINEEVLPELTEEFVKSVSEEFTSVDQFKEKLKADLQADYDDEYDQEVLAEIQQAIQNGSTFNGAPKAFADRLYSTLVDSLKEQADQYGMDAGTVAYYYYGVDAENYEEGLRTYVNDTLVPQYIMLGAIANKENITVSDKDVDEDIENMLKANGATYTVDEYKAMIGDVTAYKEYLQINRVLEFLADNANGVSK